MLQLCRYNSGVSNLLFCFFFCKWIVYSRIIIFVSQMSFHWCMHHQGKFIHTLRGPWPRSCHLAGIHYIWQMYWIQLKHKNASVHQMQCRYSTEQSMRMWSFIGMHCLVFIIILSNLPDQLIANHEMDSQTWPGIGRCYATRAEKTHTMPKQPWLFVTNW